MTFICDDSYNCIPYECSSEVFTEQLSNYFENLELIGSLAFINMLDEKPPLLYDAPDFSFDTRVHDPRGRMINIQFELSPKK